YAHSVLHHFKYFEDVLEKCHYCLKADGIMISFDPLQTYIPMYLLRKIYRPFQSDKEWEYPFNKENVKLIKKHFNILGINGVMGNAKLSIPIYYLNKRLGIRIGKKLMAYDQLHSTKEGKLLYNCLQVTFLLKRINY
nr:hypothetical protein [Salinivirgaceae bacterium]